jgi:polysaccharide export outer membrane protein
MQPVRLGAKAWCLVAIAPLAVSLLVPPCRAQQQQPVLETPQQINDRIKALSSTVRVAPHDYVIGNGDMLDIDVFDVKELSREVRVSQTGSIGIPLVPVRLHVAGLTEVQAEQKIAEVLEANGLVSHAEVSVSVKERKSKPITVVGAVGHAMVYQADRPVTILEVLAEAGGVANDAGDTVIVTRPSADTTTDPSEPPEIGPEDPAASVAPKDSTPSSSAPAPTPKTIPVQTLSAPDAQKAAPAASASTNAPTASANPAASSEPPPLSNTITINLSQLMETGDTTNNIILQAGDVVTVPHAGIVYVLGAVSRPGGFVMANDRGEMTTLKILSLAGGLNATAKKDHAVIIRKDSQGQQHEVAVNLKKVLDRSEEDVQLQPSDILYVPNSASRQAMLRAIEVGIGIGTAVALYRVVY